MTWNQVLTSSVGRKLVMALTGLSLILFLIVHVIVNACIWANVFVPGDNGEIFNKAAQFLGQTLVPRVLEIGLFLFFIIHIVQGYMLEAKQSTKRSTPYSIKFGNRGSRWYSRSMGLLGTIIFLFLIIHIKDFWVPSRFGGLAEVQYIPDGPVYHNLYGKMIEVFQSPWIVILYVVGCISLAYHLMHGFQSAFRTLGVNNKKHLKVLVGLGYAFAIIVCLVFALMPVSIYFGWVK